MHGVARDWSFDVETVAVTRTQMLKMYLTPLVAVAIVAAFLLVMVALGLTGVLWQTVTQRTREIGARRANGAARHHIHAQITGEMLLLTTAAIAVAVVLVAQVPLLPLPDDVMPSRSLVLVSLGAAAALMYAITLACAAYPSRIAARVEPADALRYE
jgi:putative ABC transport system permease protein